MRALTVVAVLSIMGCDDKDTDRVCDPGATQDCICSPGVEGVQSCEDDGSGWSACDCSEADTMTDQPEDTTVDSSDDPVADPIEDPTTEDTGGLDTVTDVTADADDAIDTPIDVPDEEVIAGGVVGDPCTSPADCLGIPGGTPICLDAISGTTITMPNGFCSADCTTAADCGAGNTCQIASLSGDMICLQPCTLDSECRESEGYTCMTIPTVGDFCLGPLT